MAGLDCLNEDQKAAVVNDLNSNLMIIAPPGSGKTLTLVYRISYLIQQGIDPSNILALTFTNKAASEMRTRVKSLISSDISGLTISTFHQLGLSILRKHSPLVRIAHGFKIVSGKQLLPIIEETMLKFLVEHKFEELKGCENVSEEENTEFEELNDSNLNYIPPGGIKYVTDVISRSKIDKAFTKKLPKPFVELIHLYNSILHDKKMIDFADMLCMPYMLLGVHRTVLAEYQRQYKHILIDEFQDCNNLEIDIIRLIGKYSKITVCGDDDQSIYS